MYSVKVIIRQFAHCAIHCRDNFRTWIARQLFELRLNSCTVNECDNEISPPTFALDLEASVSTLTLENIRIRRLKFLFRLVPAPLKRPERFARIACTSVQFCVIRFNSRSCAIEALNFSRESTNLLATHLRGRLQQLCTIHECDLGEPWMVQAFPKCFLALQQSLGRLRESICECVGTSRQIKFTDGSIPMYRQVAQSLRQEQRNFGTLSSERLPPLY
jgi:hypothetical protein